MTKKHINILNNCSINILPSDVLIIVYAAIFHAVKARDDRDLKDLITPKILFVHVHF